MLAFGFCTERPNGTLLFQSSTVSTYRRRLRQSEGVEGFVSMYMYKGYLVVHLGLGTERDQMVTLRSTNVFGDGYLHSVLLTRNDQTITLFIDDTVESTATLTEEGTIGGKRAQLFIGGFPDWLQPPSEQMPEYATVSLHGYADDALHAENEGMAASAKQNRLGVDGSNNGRLVYETSNSGEVEPDSSTLSPIVKTTIMPQKCSPPTMKENGEKAFRFGVSADSHSRVNFDKPYPSTTKFEITFDIKTEATNALLVAWANYNKFSQYFMLTITEGRVQAKLKGHRVDEYILMSGVIVIDGLWHTVKVNKNGRYISLTVDGTVQELNKVPNKMGVVHKRVYVGGMKNVEKKKHSIPYPIPFHSICLFYIANKISNAT